MPVCNMDALPVPRLHILLLLKFPVTACPLFYFKFASCIWHMLHLFGVVCMHKINRIHTPVHKKKVSTEYDSMLFAIQMVCYYDHLRSVNSMSKELSIAWHFTKWKTPNNHIIIWRMTKSPKNTLTYTSQQLTHLQLAKPCQTHRVETLREPLMA